MFRLWSWSAPCDGPPEYALQSGNEFGIRKWPAGAFGAAHGGEGRVVAGIGCQKACEIADEIEDRPDRHETG